MTILGRGDLSPRRRSHRPGMNWIVVAGVLGVGAVVVLGIVIFGGGSSEKTPHALPVCPPAPVVKPAKPAKVHLSVLNATSTPGLASAVAADLEHRGFHVLTVGNAAKPLTSGTVLVSYSPGKLLAAQAVAAEFPNAKLVKGTVPGVQLGVGPDFSALSASSDVAAARQRFIQADVPATPTPTPSATPTCRPAPVGNASTSVN